MLNENRANEKLEQFSAFRKQVDAYMPEVNMEQTCVFTCEAFEYISDDD